MDGRHARVLAPFRQLQGTQPLGDDCSGGSAIPRAQGGHCISPWTLRFDNPQAEEGFVRLNLDNVYTNLRWTACVVSATAALLIAQLIATRGWSSHAFSDGVTHGIHLTQIGIVAVLIVLLTLAIVLSKIFAGWLSKFPRSGEFLGIIMVPFIMTSAVFVDRWYLTKLIGFSTSIWGEDTFSDTRVLLALDAMLSFTHMFCPIRWCMWFGVECFTLLLYVFLAIGLGSSESGLALSNLILLSSLVISSSIGKRCVERQSREAFAKVAHERSLRVAAEAQADAAPAWRPDHPQVANSELGSVDGPTSAIPSTAPTDGLFVLDPQGTAEHLAEKMQDIEILGQREKWLLSERDVQLDVNGVLGEGGFGFVVGGSVRGTPVAVKVPKSPADAAFTVEHISSLANELRMLRMLRHPNIVMFYGACIIGLSNSGVEVVNASSPPYIALVLELVDGVTLTHYIRQGFPTYMTGAKGVPDDSAKLVVLLGICRALQYLHSLVPVVVHGDLKPGNILVESLSLGPCAKLIDFGLSSRVTKRQTTLGGTLAWMAPEVIAKKRPCCASDVFSFGRLLYFAICGKAPLEGMRRDAIMQLLRAPKLPSLVWPETAQPSETCKRLIEMCSEGSVNSRPTMDELLRQLNLLHSSDPNTSKASFDTSSSSTQITSSMSTDFQAVVKHIGDASGSQGQREKSVESWHRILKVPEGTLTQCATSSGQASLQAIAEEGEDNLLAPQGNTIALSRVYSSSAITPEYIRQIAMVDMMIRWNLEYSSDSCCKYHAVTSMMQQTCSFLAGMPCKPDYPKSAEVPRQCPSCCLMQRSEMSGDMCDFCGNDIGVAKCSESPFGSENKSDIAVREVPCGTKVIAL